MHAKPDLRVFLNWMIAGSGSVITDVIGLKLMLKFSLASMLIAVTAISVCFGVFAPTPNRIPTLFSVEHFDSSTLVNATNYFIARGEESTIVELTEIAAKERDNSIDLTERVGWVCRILWANEKTPIRQPLLGGLSGIDFDSTKLNTWPLYPVAKSGDTYFVLSQGYSLGGRPEWIPNYIEHCRQNGTFRRWSLTVPARDQAMQDIQTFRDSTRWRAEFPNGGAKWTWDFIQGQAYSIGKNDR